MPDDHDILIRMDEKMDRVLEHVSEQRELNKGFETRIRSLEDRVVRQSGFWAGGKWAAHLLVSLPPSVAAWLVGRHA